MIVCIEGNIGAGKSSVLNAIGTKAPGTWNIVPEPVQEWGPWLENYYSNKTRWAFALQMRVLASFAAAKPHITTDRMLLVERSCLSCRYVFTQIMYNNAYMSEKEWSLFKRFAEIVSWEPDVIVYIKVPVDQCLERIDQRAKSQAKISGDDQIDAAYLQRIDFQYANMLNFFKGTVIEVDGSKSTTDIADEIVHKLSSLQIHK